MEKHEQRKLRRISAESHAVRRCAPGTRLTHCQSSREIAYSGSQADQRSRPLTLRNYSKLGGCVSSEGGKQSKNEKGFIMAKINTISSVAIMKRSIV